MDKAEGALCARTSSVTGVLDVFSVDDTFFIDLDGMVVDDSEERCVVEMEMEVSDVFRVGLERASQWLVVVSGGAETNEEEFGETESTGR